MFDWLGKNGDKSGKCQGILISCVSDNPVYYCRSWVQVAERQLQTYSLEICGLVFQNFPIDLFNGICLVEHVEGRIKVSHL